MAYNLLRRNAIGSIEGIPSTFSSWNKCMSKAYCKWPAIAGIIIASLIVFSLIWCLARCLCCGASCCCNCLRCLDCFTPSRHGSSREPRHKDQYQPMPTQGFQPVPGPIMIYQPNAAPQFATFDAPSGKIHEDSLPAMPSWETAQQRRVEDATLDHAESHGEDVEMGRLEHQPQRTGRSGYSQISDGHASPTPLPYDPHDQSTEYFGAGRAPTHPYNSHYAPRPFGTQQVPVRSESYASSNFQSRPHSPAPTYATVAPELNPDRFAQRTTSPSRGQYGQNNPQSYNQYQNQPSNYNRTPYLPSVSTRYEATEYPSPSPYTSPTQVRPPSLLQPGRKPVNGSLREI